MAEDAYSRWCRTRGVTHAHCPLAPPCEHPQPFVASDGRLLCGRCWAVDGLATEMVACTPEECPDE